MEDSKKRKLEGEQQEQEQEQEQEAEVTNASMQQKQQKYMINGGEASSTIDTELRALLEPLKKEQILDLLIKIGSQYPPAAEEIRGVASADPAHRKLFVRGLAWDTTSETLCATFIVYGEIEEGSVIIDKATGKSRGYGFITYRHMESTHKALMEPTKMIDGRMTTCSLACEGVAGGGGPVTVDQTQRKLYIGGLSVDTTSEALLTFFSKYGEIEEGAVAIDKETNRSRCFGFVTYKNPDAAKKALEDPNKILEGKAITVKYAESHRGKTGQVQLATNVLPAAMPFAAVYGKAGASRAAPANPYHAFPQNLASFPINYANNAGAAQYAQQQVGYGSIPGKTPQVTMPPLSGMDFSSYSYYSSRQR